MRKMMFMLLLLFTAVVAQAQDKDSTAQDIVGKYRFPSGSVISEVVISIEGDGFVIGSEIGNSSLVKIGEDLFSIVVYDGTAKFNRDSNKKVIGVAINAAGYTLEGSRVESRPIPLAMKRRK